MTVTRLTRTYLTQALAALPAHDRLMVAFSGGPDSLALLHALSRLDRPEPVTAVHVDHRLDRESSNRATMAGRLAEGLGVAFESLAVDVDTRGPGPEAAARRARYRALAARMNPADILLTAHHADDQAETLLLQMMRGAGPRGLSGMPRVRPLEPGYLARPLLDLPRSAITEYIRRHGLEPVMDPGNADLQRDRNFLRHRVLPRLAERWPDFATHMSRAAGLQADARRAVDELAGLDLAGVTTSPGVVDIAALGELPEYRRAPLLRHWCRQQGLEPPSARRLAELLAQIIPCGDDNRSEIRWHDHALRAWRGRLHLLATLPDESDWSVTWPAGDTLTLPDGRGRLSLSGASALPASWSAGLEVGSRRPGETIRLQTGDHRHIKGLMHAARIPPWERTAWPVLRHGDRVLAVGDRWLDADFARELEQQGTHLRWERDD